MSNTPTAITELGFEIGVLVKKDGRTYADRAEAHGLEAYWNDESPDEYGGIDIYKKGSSRTFAFLYREEQIEDFKTEYPDFFN
jgi:hypothetical protein